MTRLGVDVSSNNPHPIDWARVRAAGVDWAAIKATEGGSYLNPCAAADAAAARLHGIETWLYHFAGARPALQEADWFVAQAARIPNDGLILDYETPDCDPTWVAGFLRRSGARMLYSYRARLDQLPGTIKAGVRLWVASYGTTTPGPCDAWQWTSTGTVDGIAGPVDLSHIYFDPPDTTLTAPAVTAVTATEDDMSAVCIPTWAIATKSGRVPWYQLVRGGRRPIVRSYSGAPLNQDRPWTHTQVAGVPDCWDATLDIEAAGDAVGLGQCGDTVVVLCTDGGTLAVGHRP